MDMNYIMGKVNQKLTVLEIEQKIIHIAMGLMDEEVYSRNDAVMDLIDVIESLNFENDGLLNEIRKARKEITSYNQKFDI
ncbi:hypothetical protein [Pseudogracilibacillus sp. SO30301A]|uniref:hypothetical protein n=1 Tax=Pseudogracilibacillus sp. SO30301A TaxID=3098291 RepID=UPI00300DD52E